MTKREQVIAAIRHDGPDYTPYDIMFTKQMLSAMVEHTGNPDYIDTIGNHILKLPTRKPKQPIPGAVEMFIDEFDVVWDLSGADKDIGAVAEYQIRDVEQLRAYAPPDLDEGYVHEQCKALEAQAGDRFSVASIGFVLFERAWSLCGMEDLLCYMVTDPDAVHGLLRKLTDRALQTLKIVTEYKIDAVLYGDDWGQQRGMIMGAPLWRAMIKPYVAEMYHAAKDAGLYVAQHSCGDLREILDELIDIGLDIYQTFQPEIYDISEYKQQLRGRLTIWGGISTQKHLPFFTPDRVYSLALSTIKVLGAGGGYIAAPTHDVPGDVPPANIEALVKAFQDQAAGMV